MTLLSHLTIVDSRSKAAATCLVCAKEIPAGEGITALYEDRFLRFKCPGCYSRFAADPEPYLAGQSGGCHDHEHGGPSAAERMPHQGDERVHQ